MNAWDASVSLLQSAPVEAPYTFLGVTQLREAMTAPPGGEKRSRGHAALQQTQSTVPAGFLPGVTQLRAALAAQPTAETDFKRQRWDDASFPTSVASADATPAADRTMPRSIFKYPDPRQENMPPLNTMIKTHAVAPQPNRQLPRGLLTPKLCPCSTKWHIAWHSAELTKARCTNSDASRCSAHSHFFGPDLHHDRPPTFTDRRDH